MNKYRLNFLAYSIIALFIFSVANAQNKFMLVPENSTLKITGTSTIHDWEMEAIDLTCKVIAQADSNNIEYIRQIDFTCPVDQITSDKRLMENKAHDALKENHYPEITFKSGKAQNIKISENKAKISGLLSIAGETREISFTSDLNPQTKGRFTASGNVSLKMTNFNIDPPTVFLGTLKTGDKVNIEFNFEFLSNPDEVTNNK